MLANLMYASIQSLSTNLALDSRKHFSFTLTKMVCGCIKSLYARSLPCLLSRLNTVQLIQSLLNSIGLSAPSRHRISTIQSDKTRILARMLSLLTINFQLEWVCDPIMLRSCGSPIFGGRNDCACRSGRLWSRSCGIWMQ